MNLAKSLCQRATLETIIILPSKSVNARRAADHNRRLNVVDHNQFVIRSLKSVNTKTPQAKHNMKTTKKVWKAKVVASVKPQWKPTGRHFTLSFGHTVADSITERLKRATTYIFRQIDSSLLSRTASIRESGTSVLEDLKALSWKTCQEEQTATGKEISNPFLADSLLKTIRLSLHLVIATKH
ncbi:hypothetical protein Tco_0163203 [Tanacetum coccineum]